MEVINITHFIINGAVWIGGITLVASLIGLLVALLQKTDVIELIFNKSEVEERKKIHRITITIDGASMTVESTKAEDVEAALKLARTISVKSKASTGTDNSSKTEEGPSIESSTS